MSQSTTVVAVTCLLVGACTELPDVERGVCGNHVVEPGEDCDGFAPEGAACAAPEDAHACRFDCAASACPAGLGCGLDGVCRGGGGFASAPLGPWTFDVARMTATDVDGDRRSDLVGMGPAGISVRFSAPDGRLDDRHDVPLQLTGAPATGDIDGDGRADVFAPIEIGMLAYAGSAERRVDAVPFTVFAAGAVSEPMHAGAVQVWGAFIPITYLTIIQQAGMCFAQFCDVAAAVTVPPAALTVATLQPVARGELDGGLTSEELVLAATGATSAYVYEVETFNPGTGDIARPRLRQTLSLPGPARTAPRLLAYDGDGRLDLMIGVEVGGELRVAVALGNLSGQFNAATVEARFDGFMNAGCSTSRWPLAVGDLTGDAAPEWVGDKAICVDIPLIGFVAYAFPRVSSPLREAVIADVNRDGASDLVAAYDQVAALAVFLGGGGLLYNQSTVVTDRPVHDLRAGDYDGNYLGDVAFVLPASLAPDAGDQVQVLFGDSDQVLAPQRMAGFGIIEDILPADFVVSPTTLDRATDLVIVSRRPGTQERGGGLLLGDPSRQMISPLILDGVTAIGAATGHFFDPEVVNTALLVGAPTGADQPLAEFAVFMLGHDGETFIVDTDPVELDPVGFALACAVPAVGDYDGDELDEVLLIDFDASSPTCARDPNRPAAQANARLASLEPGAAALEVTTAQGLAVPGMISVADLDADGDADAVVPFIGRDGLGDGLLVLRGDASGLDLGGERTDLIDGVRAAAIVDLAPGAPPGLALIAGDQLLLAEPDGAGGWLAPAVLAEVEEEGSVSGLAAFDVDGDGLQDLVALRGGRIWTWLREPGPLAGDAPGP